MPLDQNNWDLLLQYAREDNRAWFINRKWLHLKWYNRNVSDLNPDTEQSFTVGGVVKCEIPNEREIMYFGGTNRFSLMEKHKMAWLAENTATCSYETMPALRKRGREQSFGSDRYWDGEYDNYNGMYGYTKPFLLNETCIFLDLRKCDTHFFRLLGNEAIAKATYAQLFNFENSDYHLSRMIALKAWAAGFNGIAYTSVRTPRDLSTDVCIAFFGPEDLLTPYSDTDYLRRVR